MSDQPSDPPADHPDPTRDTTGDGAIGMADAMPPTDPAAPADLPDDADAPAGRPAYDTSFGRETPAEPSWVPQRAGPHPPRTTPPPTGPTTRPGPRTVELGSGHAARVLGGRLQTWHVVAIVAGLLVPAGFWALARLGDGLDPVARASAGATRVRPTSSRPVLAPPRSIVVPPLPGATSPPASRPPSALPTRSAQTAPPAIVTVPDIPVTPVPTDARTIRFESYAAGGARVEVSLSDARHTRYDYPVRTAPLAFETAIGKNVSSNDYYSLRVRIYDPTGSGDRGAVSCRILVDGIVLTSQQGRGYANCYVSPYYDIQRR
ncbi:superantigen-like protein SSL4 [Terrabacter terrigena]|uniref:Uncharacterized protein n=1 Tax=Terrabacter terrigena TaxID=574718 RepID=A0ABW3N0B7_9MICO